MHGAHLIPRGAVVGGSGLKVGESASEIVR